MIILDGPSYVISKTIKCLNSTEIRPRSSELGARPENYQATENGILGSIYNGRLACKCIRKLRFHF